MKKQIINYQDKWKEQKIEVNQLELDPKNIRLGVTYNSQGEIINDLFINEAAMNILENIAEIGYFPDEPPVVVKEGRKFIVLEGNRRVASLKAMIDPNIAPPTYSARIEKLMKNRIAIKKVTVHIATSRDEAMEYLAAKHTKTTRKPWSALRRAYFYYAQKEQGQSVQKLIDRYKGVDIAGYIKMHEMHNVALALAGISDETRKKVANTGTFNISTLERFYNDKYVQEAVGIEFAKTGEATVPDTPSFDKVYSRVINDIVAGIATSRKELAKDDDRKRYIDSVVSEVLDGHAISKTKKKAASAFKKASTRAKKQKGLIPSTLINTLESPGVGRVVWELQNIDYAKFPNAAADLLRTFLEITLKKYLSEIGSFRGSSEGKFITLGSVLSKIKSELTKAGNHQLVQVVNEIENNKWYLDTINHNPDVFAVENRVKDAWDQIDPLIRFVFNDYNQRKARNTL